MSASTCRRRRLPCWRSPAPTTNCSWLLTTTRANLRASSACCLERRSKWQFVLEGDFSWVTDLDVSADGTLLASIDPDRGVAAVWDLVGAGPAQRVSSRLLRRVLERSGDQRRRDAGDVGQHGLGRRQRRDPPHADSPAGRVGDVEFIDAEHIVLADGMTARVVDIETGGTVMTLAGHGADIRAIDVSCGRAVRCHRLRRRIGEDLGCGASRGSSPVMTLAGHAGTVWEVQFSPDGRYVTSIAGREQLDIDFVYEWPRDWEARTWDVSVAGSAEWLTTPTRDSDVAFSPDARSVVVAGEDTGAAVWDLEPGTWQW